MKPDIKEKKGREGKGSDPDGRTTDEEFTASVRGTLGKKEKKRRERLDGPNAEIKSRLGGETSSPELN